MTEDADLSKAVKRRISAIGQSMRSAEDAISSQVSDRLDDIVKRQLAGFTASEKERFIQELFRHHNVHRACVAVGISRRAALTARDKDPVFADAWVEALASHLDDVEDHVLTMAKSSKTPLWAIFALKSHRPEVYGDQVTVRNEQQHELHIHLHGAADPQSDPPSSEGRGEVLDAEWVEGSSENRLESGGCTHPAGSESEESNEGSALTPVPLDKTPVESEGEVD